MDSLHWSRCGIISVASEAGSGDSREPIPEHLELFDTQFGVFLRTTLATGRLGIRPADFATGRLGNENV